MALITVGSLDEFSAQFTTTVQARPDALKGVHALKVIGESSAPLRKERVEFPNSDTPRGVAVKRLSLSKGFGGFLDRLFDATHDVYFVAWAWDYSGRPVSQYPGTEAAGANTIGLKAGDLREFIGAGIPMFVARPVVSGLALRIQLWESKAGTRKLGETLEKVATTIQESELNSVLSVLATATGATLATVTLLKEAALQLGKVVGTILKSSSDDTVDFFEGFYPASAPWAAGEEKYKGTSSEIVLQRFV